jgi:hypothetical protein
MDTPTLCANTDFKDHDINVILGSCESLPPGHVVVTLKRAAETIRKVGFESLLQKSISFQQPKKQAVLAQKNNSAAETSNFPSVVVLQNMMVDWLVKKQTKNTRTRTSLLK